MVLNQKINGKKIGTYCISQKKAVHLQAQIAN